MSTPSAEERIRELSRDLRPVRPIPRLRAVVAAAVAVGAAAPVAHALLGGPGLRTGAGASWDPAHLVSLAGLVLAGVGSLAAAFAAAVPGRGPAVPRAAWVAVAGGLLTVSGVLGALLAREAWAPPAMLDCLACLGRAFVLAVAPVLLACAFVVHAVVRRTAVATAFALAGGVALGAAGVHATCPNAEPLHWLLAHSLAPALAVLLLTAPLSVLLARSARRA